MYMYVTVHPHMMYVMTPMDQMSHDRSYFSGPNTSGAEIEEEKVGAREEEVRRGRRREGEEGGERWREGEGGRGREGGGEGGRRRGG